MFLDEVLAFIDIDKSELFKNHKAETFTCYSDIQNSQHTNLVNHFFDISLTHYHPIKHFSPSEVKIAIQKYSLKKSSGYDLVIDEIARCLLKRTIVLPTTIFNATLGLFYFPLLWKFTTIIQVIKPNKPPDIPLLFRPISLLNFFAKILESLNV